MGDRVDTQLNQFVKDSTLGGVGDRVNALLNQSVRDNSLAGD